MIHHIRRFLRSVLQPRSVRPIRRARLFLELLEHRLVPANLDVDAVGNAVLTANPGEVNVEFIMGLNQATDRYEFTDTFNTITVSGAGSGAAFADVQGAGTNTVTAKRGFINSITLSTDINSDT